MSRIKASGSDIEKRLGSLLWKNGYRYRKQYNIVGKPDFVFVKNKIAIFCDSSFWHGYKFGKTNRHKFKSNRRFWENKIKRNIKRDIFVNKELKKLGWKVARFWDFQIMNNGEKCLKKINLLAEK